MFTVYLSVVMNSDIYSDGRAIDLVAVGVYLSGFQDSALLEFLVFSSSAESREPPE